MPIYIVDDNVDLAEFLFFLLDDMGHTVHKFTHPEHAIEHMKSEKTNPSILITDYNLPVMSGYDLHLKIQSLVPSVKTIVISGRNVVSEIGGLHFIQKPFSSDEITQAVEKMIATG